MWGQTPNSNWKVCDKLKLFQFEFGVCPHISLY